MNAEDLYLRVTLNGVALPGVLPFQNTANGLQASEATLRTLGLKVPDSERLVQLSALSGTSVEFDSLSQIVYIVVPVALLDRPPVLLNARLATSEADYAPSELGAILNYDLYAESADGWRMAGMWNEVRVFGAGQGIFSHSYLIRTGERTGKRSFRLDSRWQWDQRDAMQTVEVGDTVTSGLSWMRRARVGGIALRRNFSLQPYLAKAPLPQLAGEAALPSTVELVIDGVHQSVHQVQPGPFRIDSGPRLNGAGTAEIQVRDIFGQVRTTNIDFYGTPALLRRGLSDWAVEAGLPRLDYGSGSSTYSGSPLFNAIGRYGVSDRLTLEAALQARSSSTMAGVGASALLGDGAGVITPYVAVSRTPRKDGNQYGLGYSWRNRSFSVSANSMVRSATFSEAADLGEADSWKRRDSVFAGGQFGATYVGLAYAREFNISSTRAALSATASMQLNRGATLSVGVDRDLGPRRATSLFLQLIFPFESSRIASVSARLRGPHPEFAAETYQAALDQTDGWGWRLRSTTGHEELKSAEAQVMRSTETGQWALSALSNSRGTVATRASGTGSLLLHRNGFHLMRSAPDAFAIVRTDGVADVPIRLENRLVGTSNLAGELLVTDLISNQRNRISIDQDKLPINLRPSAVELDVVPRTRSGSIAAFRIERLRPFHGRVRDWHGRALQVGLSGRLIPSTPGATSKVEQVTVGYDGEIYLDNLAQNAVVVFDVESRSCEVRLSPQPLTSFGITDVECQEPPQK